MSLPGLDSSIGRKAVMGLTGLILTGFIIMHLLDNMLIYLGPQVLNAFAATLHRLGPVLWAARLVLIAAVVLHIGLGIALARENRAARPIPYAAPAVIGTTYAARTMVLSGLLLGAFIVYHLLHFTFRVTHPGLAHLTDAQGRHDVYAMVVQSFLDPRLVLAYVVAMGLLCLHLSHGIASTFQSLGLADDRSLPRLERAGRLAAAAIFVGYASIPFAVVFGLIGPAGLP